MHISKFTLRGLRSLISIALFSMVGAGTTYAQTIYYTTSTSVGKIESDGTGQKDLVTGQSFLLGITLNGTASTVYFSDSSTAVVNLLSADGGTITELTNRVDHPGNIAFHPTRNLLYVTDGFSLTGTILTIDPNTGTVTTFVENSFTENIQYLTLDTVNDVVYWAHGDSTATMISKASLDDPANTIQTIFTLPNVFPGPIAVDGTNGKVYLSNRNTGDILSIPLTGGSTESIVANSGIGTGLAVSPANNLLCWETFFPAKIVCSDLTGSNVRDVIAFAVGTDELTSLFISPAARQVQGGIIPISASVVVNDDDNSATVTAEQFDGVSLKKAVKKAKIRYRFELRRTGDLAELTLPAKGKKKKGGNRSVVKRVSKRNEVTFKKLKPGEYSVRYRAEATVKKKTSSGGTTTRVAARTSYSSPTSFRVR